MILIFNDGQLGEYRPNAFDIVNLMRKNDKYFAEFANSDTAKLFAPPIFENKKRNHGYWFKILLYICKK